MLPSTTLPAGSLDPSFNRTGMVTTPISPTPAIGASALQPNGDIVVVGSAGEASSGATVAVARYLPDGQLDPSFGLAGTGVVVLDSSSRVVTAEAVAIVEYPNSPDYGKIVVSGSWYDPATTSSGVALARFDPDGSLDATFGTGGIVMDTRAMIQHSQAASDTDIGLFLAIQTDGKIVVGGTTELPNDGGESAFVERFHEDGSPDSSLSDPGLVAALFTGTDNHVVGESALAGLALDSGGNIVVAAAEVFSTAPYSLMGVARLMPDGQPDPSFGSGGFQTAGVASPWFVTTVNGLAIDPTGDIVVSGTANRLNSSAADLIIARFDAQGNFDPTFDHGAMDALSFPSVIADFITPTGVAVQRDDKILLVVPTTASARTAFGLARLNSDGTLDTGFAAGGEVVTPFYAGEAATSSLAHSILVQRDGNLVETGIAGGSFALARYLGEDIVINTGPVAPAVGPIVLPLQPVLVASVLSASATFTETGATGPHTAVWNWGDGTTSAGTVTESIGSGSGAGSHAYARPGIYMVTLTVTDEFGVASSAMAPQDVVVYNPLAGSITGNGRIVSPRGAVPGNPALTGNSTFRISAQYAPNGGVPSGDLVFKLTAARLTFRSTGLNWLVVSGRTAWLGGTGQLSGAGSYGFVVSAGIGNGRAAKIRIQIVNNATGQLVYDSQPGAPTNAQPSTQIRGGSVALHIRRRQR